MTYLATIYDLNIQANTVAGPVKAKIEANIFVNSIHTCACSECFDGVG